MFLSAIATIADKKISPDGIASYTLLPLQRWSCPLVLLPEQ